MFFHSIIGWKVLLIFPLLDVAIESNGKVKQNDTPSSETSLVKN